MHSRASENPSSWRLLVANQTASPVLRPGDGSLRFALSSASISTRLPFGRVRESHPWASLPRHKHRPTSTRRSVDNSASSASLGIARPVPAVPVPATIALDAFSKPTSSRSGSAPASAPKLVKHLLQQSGGCLTVATPFPYATARLICRNSSSIRFVG